MRVIWSERALADLREIKAWIAADSPCYALRMVERIVQQADEKESRHPSSSE